MAARNLTKTNQILLPDFFDRSTLIVAQDLLGKFLTRRIGRQTIALMITEVEAYDGPQDKASHAHKGPTPRAKIMFGPAGYWYVYFTYGIHWLLNIVTGPENYPAAVLIRGAREIQGPARITKFLNIDKSLNGQPAVRKSGLWLEDRGVKIKPDQIKKSPRVGIPSAADWRDKPYRFYV